MIEDFYHEFDERDKRKKEAFDFEDKVDQYLLERQKLKARNDAGICRHYTQNTCDKGDDCR